MTGQTRQSFKLSDLLTLNLLLIFFPVALISQFAHLNDALTFVAAGLAIVPLSGLLGEATEDLAALVGQTLGGLLNATLGNAAELIITMFALREGLIDLVKASIVGSVLGNLLLVTGFSFLFGGLKNGLQTFERRSASSNATMVILAFLVLAIPSALNRDLDKGHDTFFSVGIALIMIVLYALSMIYTLVDPQSRMKAAPESEDVEERPDFRRALVLLLVATIGIVFMSEALVETVDSVANGAGLSEFFVGIIIIPFIGNVAEHVVAVRVALKNRMDLSLSISLGSSLQVALFVAPVLVFVSLLFPKHLLLVFNLYELLGLAAASVVAALVSHDGESNWLEGAQLLAVYLMLALAFFLLPAP